MNTVFYDLLANYMLKKYDYEKDKPLSFSLRALSQKKSLSVCV